MYTVEMAQKDMKNFTWSFWDKTQYNRIVKKIRKAISNKKDYIVVSRIRPRVRARFDMDGYHTFEEDYGPEVYISWA